mmetsp:Transcript_2901/g.7149  ORF Transcript_2901/g.7149 Transcript_2901/m.7149 type:complete len:165 (+) Transcript_2901:27-521(+)
MSSWFSAGAAFLRRAVVRTETMAMTERAYPGRAQRALYGGKKINFGNNVPKWEHRTRRRWNPNVQTKKLWSDCFDTMLRLRVTTYVLKTVDKVGGLDNYLAHTPDHKLASKLGVRLKLQVIEQRRRIAAGEPLLPPPPMAVSNKVVASLEESGEDGQSSEAVSQ